MTTLGLPSGKVVGRVLAGVLDTFDLGFEPNNEPLKGTVTFRCSAPNVAVPNGTPTPALVKMLDYEVALDELGYLTHQGNQYVMLPCPTPDTNPTSWVWIVSFDLTYDGDRVTYPEFAIEVGPYTPGDESTATDLAKSVTVPIPSGGWLSKGDPGTDGVDGDSIEDVTLTGTDLVFQFRRGDTGEVVNKPVAVPALTVATAAAQSALDSMEAAGDYAAVAGSAASLATTKAEAAAASAVEAANYVGGVADNSVSTAKIQARAVTGAKIGIEAILGENIAAGTMNGSFHFNPGSIPQDRLQGTGPFTDFLAAKQDLSAKGQNNGYAPLDSTGKIPQANMPAVALQDFLGAVASQAAMLALTGQRGDWATRTDRGTDWQLIGEPSTTLANWRERTYPASPVSSVAGRTGAVTLSVSDVSNAVATSDGRLTDTRTPTDNTVATAKLQNNAVTLAKMADAAKAEGINYDHTVTGARAVGLGDLGADGFVFPYAVTLTTFTVKFGTADASGATVVRILKNGSATGMPADVTVTAPATSAVTATGSYAFAAGDVLTVQIVSVGTTPGNKLKVIGAGVRS